MSNESILGASGNELEIIEFYIDEISPEGDNYRGFYAMNVAKVLEIIRQPQITSMPGLHHEAALGTFNLRNKVLPLVDLGAWLGKKIRVNGTEKVIVSEFSKIVTAFLVSGVTHIHRITWDRVEPPGKYLQIFSNDSITGVIRLEGRIAFILDIEHIIGTINPNLSMESEAITNEEASPEFGLGCKILVADDSQAVRRLINNMLTKSGFTVELVSTGKEALNRLLAYKEQASNNNEPLNNYVDLVVSDIEMPEMDGHTLLRNLNEDSYFSELPFVLFSSHITEAIKQKGLLLNANDQISKPDLPFLAHRIRTLIKECSGK